MDPAEISRAGKERMEMTRSFNAAGSCDPQLHYMVDIQSKLEEIRALIDSGAYFTINRARQYGKTTTIKALKKYLAADYVVISLDFQRIGNAGFATEHAFSKAFAEYLFRTVKNRKAPVHGLKVSVLEELVKEVREDDRFALNDLFPFLNTLCETAEKQVVLIIDEVDSATNNQVFLDFLAQLRSDYLDREEIFTFQAVILAGVYDVKNIRRKIRTNEEHKVNSPWNIATDFLVNMSFSKDGIAGMLEEYEADHHTGMDVDETAGLLYDYTSGYPFLVSRICKLIDERIAGSEVFPDRKAAWTREGFLEAVKMLQAEKNTLFESLIGKLIDYPELSSTLYSILFAGDRIVYNPDEEWIDVAVMFGFIKNDAGTVVIANRVFETRLYNYFLTKNEAQSSEIFRTASQNKLQYIHNGHLDMDLVLDKYTKHFGLIYGDNAEEFDEEEGRRRFLLYLRPIINGTGNYYIEARTRNARRMDVIVDYQGEQFIIELKIWRGNAYNERGEKQLSDYLDYFGLKKGYMLSYNFNQTKETGVREIHIGDRVLVEAVV